jgi:hypothetical protein
MACHDAGDHPICPGEVDQMVLYAAFIITRVGTNGIMVQVIMDIIRTSLAGGNE